MKHLVLILSFVFCTRAFTQDQTAYIKDQILVQINPKSDIDQVIKSFQDYPVYLQKTVSKSMGIYLLEFRQPQRSMALSDHDILNKMRSFDQIKVAQFNHIVENRAIPNDTLYSQQWSLNNTGQDGGTPDIDMYAEMAWEITTGGLTLEGDSIVVAVVDNGFHLNHPDINFWKNIYEIPNDTIDNDSNGYVDDIYGWNALNDDADINTPGDNHGTHVAGIMGAKGNNKIGISGISWNQKVMVVSREESTSEDVIITAYAYVLKQRQIYNETLGDSGTFVVSLNSSFGVNNAKPEDLPLWCAMYDSMGNAGILNVAATVNSNTNVDDAGDIPTTCPSPFLIAVTRSNQLGEKTSRAGWGPQSIDLAAPGSKILSTTGSIGYNNMSGTSMSCPQVTGAIGLMYANIPEEKLALKYSQPDSLAKLVKHALLVSVDTNSTLEAKTVTGGILNLYRALVYVETDTLVDISINDVLATDFVVYPNPSSDYIVIANQSNFNSIEIYDLLGHCHFHKVYTGYENKDLIHINHFPIGLYFIRLEDQFGKVNLQRIQKY